MKRFNAFAKRPLQALLNLAAMCTLAMCSASNGATPCAVANDCWNTPEGARLGRCAPKEVACVAGSCRVACPQLCEVVDPHTNPCRDAKQVCNESRSGRVDLPYCASGPIACDSSADCPLYVPVDDANEGAEWTCEAGVCHFPGFDYAWRG